LGGSRLSVYFLNGKEGRPNRVPLHFASRLVSVLIENLKSKEMGHRRRKPNTDHKQDPSPRELGLTKTRYLHEDISNVRGAVGDVRQDCQRE